MKKFKFLCYVLSLLVLASCSATRTVKVNEVDDDVYWSRKDEPSKGTSYKDVEPWNKSKGPSASLELGYEPGLQNDEGNSEPKKVTSEDQRGQDAYHAWMAKRGFSSKVQPDTPKVNTNSNVILDDKNEERDARRFGSERQYYYNDQYYNSLSNNWGWTSFYNPVVRPGYYNWAPGWNIGLNWNSNSGFNFGVGYNYNSGYGGYGYNPYGYNSFGGYGYNPYGYNSYGYSPYGYYNPWGYGYSYGYNSWGYPYYGRYYGNYGYYGYGCGYNRYNYCNGCNDVVSNRPLLHQRYSVGSSIPAAGSRPGNEAGAGKYYNPDGSAMGLNNNGNQPAMARPAYSNGGNTSGTNRPQTDPNIIHTSRPGGDLKMDENGRPVYISPNTNTRPSYSGESNSAYSERPGGELRNDARGNSVYVPARPRNYGAENNSTPALNADMNPRPDRGATFESNNSRPAYSNPAPASRFPDNNTSFSRPVYSAPSYSQPSESRPGNSAPTSRPATSGGSGTGTYGGHTSGGMRPR